MNEDKEKKLDNIKVLAVDDEDSVRELYDTVLSGEGCEVQTALDGRTAMDMLGKEKYDLVLLDLKMPDYEGTDVLKRMKDRLSDTIVIIITAYPSLDSAVEAIKAGVYDYIVKPFSPAQLRLAVGRAADRITLEKENEHLLMELKKKNECLEDNVDELEHIASEASKREKELEKRIEELEAELARVKGGE